MSRLWDMDQSSLVSSCTRRRRKTELEKLLEAQSCSSVVSAVVDLGKRKRNDNPFDWSRPQCEPKRRRARSATRPRNLTDKRKGRILEFIKKASPHPAKYGAYGSEMWIDNVISYLKGNVYVYRITRNDVKLWLQSNPIFYETHLKLTRSKRTSDESSSSTSARPGPSRKVMKPPSAAASRTPSNPILKETQSSAPDARQTVESEPEPEPPKKLMATPKANTTKADEIPAALIPKKEKDDATSTMKPNEAIPDTNASGACANPENERVEEQVSAAGADEGRAPPQEPRTGEEHLFRIKEHCRGIMNELTALRINANAFQQVPGINLSVVQALSYALIEVVNIVTGGI